MTNESNIERVVMRRVHRVHRLRPFLSGTALAALVCLLALWGIGREVWVAKVFENAPKNIAALPQFWLAAFENTRLAVQVLSVLTVSATLYLARETARLAARTLMFKEA